MQYNDWKVSHKADFKPWLNPEQNTLPLVSECMVCDCSLHFLLQYSAEEQLASKSSDIVEEDKQSMQGLETPPEGMECYLNMDVDEDIVTAVSGDCS